MRKLKPIGERALLKPVPREETTSSGIFLPDTAGGQQPQTAEVVALGDVDGGLSEGDVVVYAKFSGTKVKLDDDEYLLVNSDDLLGIVEG